MSQDPEQAAPPQVDEAAQGIVSMLHAILIVAGKAAMAESAAEANDFGKAALAFAQAIITLDPTRLAGGDTPEARAAAAPTRPPVKDGNHNGIIGA